MAVAPPRLLGGKATQSVSPPDVIAHFLIHAARLTNLGDSDNTNASQNANRASDCGQDNHEGFMLASSARVGSRHFSHERVARPNTPASRKVWHGVGAEDRATIRGRPPAALREPHSGLVRRGAPKGERRGKRRSGSPAVPAAAEARRRGARGTAALARGPPPATPGPFGC